MLRPVVPVLEAVHDRAVVEVMRGCTAGCRFCQAGMWYRPVRERPVEVVEAADRLLDETGCDEVSLLSLSSCDYGGVAEALARIRRLRPGLRVSLPSLRIDSAAESWRASPPPARLVTLAPEAGTPGLRDAINKGVDEAQFDEAVRATFEGGFTGLKLYFMIGLPGETDEDVLGHRPHGRPRRRAWRKEIGRGRARLSVSVSSYVPKAHTPFELEPFAGGATLRRRQRLRARRRPRGVRVAFHDVAASGVEATLARGGPGSDRLVEEAWRRGARFDGWSEHFDVRRWEDAAAAARASPSARRAVERPSWRGRRRRAADPAFLDDELARGRARRTDRRLPRRRLRRLRRLRRGDRHGRCSHDLVAASASPARGPARYLSHLDTSRAVQRTFARAGVPDRPVAGHAAQATALAAAAAARGRGRREEVAVVEVPEGVDAGDGRRCAALRDGEPARIRAARHRGRRRAASAPAAAAAEYACRAGRGRRRHRARPSNATTTQSMRSGSACRPRAGAAWISKSTSGTSSRRPVEGRSPSRVHHPPPEDGAARPQELIDLIAEWAGVEPVMRGLERRRITWDHGLPGPEAGRRKELTS